MTEKPRVELLHHFFGDKYQDWDDVSDREMLKLATVAYLETLERMGARVEVVDLPLPNRIFVEIRL